MNIGNVTRMLQTKLTPFETGLKETYRWYVRNHKPRATGFEFDDKLLALAKTSSPVTR
jgi:dTDP-D-glucose 4,6-dehydratase